MERQRPGVRLGSPRSLNKNLQIIYRVIPDAGELRGVYGSNVAVVHLFRSYKDNVFLKSAF